MSLNFRGEQDLLHYLTSTPRGRGVLREAVVGTPEIIQEVLEYNKTTYVLVKAYRDGLVEVYGPRHCRAKIAFLGRSITFPGHELAVERQLDGRLPAPYREVHYPSNKRAIGHRYSGLEQDREVRIPCPGGLSCSKSVIEKGVSSPPP